VPVRPPAPAAPHAPIAEAAPVVPAAAEHQPAPASPFASAVAAFPVAANPSSTSRTGFNSWRTRRLGLLAAAAAVGVIAIAFLMSRPGPGTGTSQATPSAAVGRSAGSVPAARPTPAPSKPPAPAANAGPPRSEILAVRRVWVRVVVDGVKTAEREMDAGERVTLPPGTTAAIRAGNAGAVRVTVNGEDRGLLGAEGEVLTRTVRIPAAER
jgi:cytoskeleton protein RodZ